jgi:hypothetical protein
MLLGLLPSFGRLGHRVRANRAMKVSFTSLNATPSPRFLLRLENRVNYLP